MKKIIILTLTVFLPCLKMQAREPYATKSEITIRIGGVDIDNLDDPGFNRPSSYWNTPLGRYNEGRYEYGRAFCTPAITISYTNEMKRWLALTINASYVGFFQREKEIETNTITDKYSSHRFTLYPMVRFSYFNRPLIRLYSALGLGIGFKSGGWSSDNNNSSTYYTSGQATFFGVSVGKKLVASWELGIGSMGIATMGIGYRF
jgi:hypothetical protein